MKPLRLQLFSLLALAGIAFAAPARAENPAPVTLYSASWCDYCTKARSYLRSRSIVHREVDIESDKGRAAFAAVGGTGKGIPLLIAGERHIRGFSASTYDAVFAAD